MLLMTRSALLDLFVNVFSHAGSLHELQTCCQEYLILQRALSWRSYRMDSFNIVGCSVKIVSHQMAQFASGYLYQVRRNAHTCLAAGSTRQLAHTHAAMPAHRSF